MSVAKDALEDAVNAATTADASGHRATALAMLRSVALRPDTHRQCLEMTEKISGVAVDMAAKEPGGLRPSVVIVSALSFVQSVTMMGAKCGEAHAKALLIAIIKELP